jgi:hypothetical protein
VTTNVPSLSFSNTGSVAPAESAIIAGLQADFNAAFGVTLNWSSATPQGQLVSSLAAMLGAQNDLILELFNQVDPASADGRMQDAIARFYYLTRITATSTAVACNCSGATGTVIPVGSLAQATDGTIYQSLAAATIPASGSVTINFAAISTGPITCLAGALSKIYRVIPGWDSITNPADGTPGRNVESRADFETRRGNSVAKNAIGILPAVRGAVLSVSGVIDAYVIENDTSADEVVGGVTVGKNSIYVCAYGGADADVAQAIWSKKSPGCAYTGSTSVTVTDTVSGYTAPLPSYTVKFQRPTAVPLYYTVTLANSSAVPSTAATQVQNAIAAAFSPKIGATVYGLSMAGVVAALGAWAQLVTITIGTSASPTGSSVALNINQIGSVSASNIAVVLV